MSVLCRPNVKMKRIFSPSGTIRLGDTRLTWPPSWPVLDAEAKRHLMQDTAWADVRPHFQLDGTNADDDRVLEG